jgi:hypothetical protein
MEIVTSALSFLLALIKAVSIPVGVIAGFFLIINIHVVCALVYWKIIDLRRYIRRVRRGKKKTHIYGIWCFVGVYGGGKTISLVSYLEKMRRKYGNRILIATNFYYENEDFHIESWKDLLKTYNKTVIFGYDELQNEFNSRDYKSFPTTLMHLLTQNRKGRGKQIVYTCQDYETVDKSFRRLTKRVIRCKTRFGRLTSCKAYTKEDFENLQNCTNVKQKMKIRPIASNLFVQTDYIRSLYDSYQYLETALSKEYVGLQETNDNN